MVETIVFIWVFAELEYCAVGVVGILTCRRRNLWCGNACVVTFHVLVVVDAGIELIATPALYTDAVIPFCAVVDAGLTCLVVELAVMNNNRTVTVAVQFRKLQSILCLGRSAGITVVVTLAGMTGPLLESSSSPHEMKIPILSRPSTNEKLFHRIQFSYVYC